MKTNESLESLSDETLIERAEELRSLERLPMAARYLLNVRDKSKLTAEHETWITWARRAEESIDDLLPSPDADNSAWIKQSESHGSRDFLVYYQVNDKHELTSRVDSAVEASMLVPIISVFNESDLYKTWMPSYTKPVKLGVKESIKLKELGRGNQIIQVKVDMPWPMKNRETVQHAWAMDIIDECNSIVVQIESESHDDDPAVPECPKNVVRVKFEGTVLIRPCPPDHPCLRNSKHNYPEGEHIYLFTLKSLVDANVGFVPAGMVNFVTRNIIGRMWANLLQIAEDVRDGKRSQHGDAIKAKSDLYGWVEKRIQFMHDNVTAQQEQSDEKSEEQKQAEANT